jgi:hypothetical protein
MAVDFINERLVPTIMQTKVKCQCGAESDVSGVTPRIKGVDVYCTVCGTVTNHDIV